jgi:hypothetical protein
MQDFNVVGLPDNAVKESRERIKSALRNCGFEFPHGQGVTINLAPADVRKEGSAFDLLMALGLVGCMGHFFGKQLNQCMFLGELSLDGSIRSVRGALSAALAAREFGLKSLAVPEANAREAAVVEGVNVFALKTLPQAVDLVNAPESFQPIIVDAKQLLSRRRNIPSTSATCTASRRQSARSKSPAQAATTSYSSGLLVRARPCLPNAFPQFCPRCRSTKPLKQRAFTASQAFSRTAAAWLARAPIARLTTLSATPV